MPTAKPSRAPTETPSAAPSRAPTPLPSLAPVDCRGACSPLVAQGAMLPIAQGTVLSSSVLLPAYFTMTVMVKEVQLAASAGASNNIVDVIDASSGQSLLSVYTTNTTNLQLRYGGVTVLSPGPGLAPLSQLTTITVTVSDRKVQISAETGGYQSATLASNVDTTGRVYQIYMSNPTSTSSAGIINFVSFAGNWCVCPHRYDHVVCYHLALYFALFLCYVVYSRQLCPQRPA